MLEMKPTMEVAVALLSAGAAGDEVGDACSRFGRLCRNYKNVQACRVLLQGGCNVGGSKYGGSRCSVFGPLPAEVVDSICGFLLPEATLLAVARDSAASIA
mmetsp:Transcript_85841/g.277137  ORF Transcript_85841/g.277137 Transcript_85841/m.277137 type:complete len:101 (-) Transcript_85841:178-480(-)